MRRAALIGIGVFGSLGLFLVSLEYRGAHPNLPPSLEAKDCASIPPSDERPNAQFSRQGGRTTRYVNVSRQGTALTIDDVVQGRDLRGYDRLELADPEPRAVVDRRGDAIRARARNFLWEHWRNRKRAYLLITLSSVDATNTSHIFIERDRIGRWRVYWRNVRQHGRIDDSPTAYSLGWVIPAGWNKPGTPLLSDQVPDPVRHRLEFRDICGEVTGSF